MAVQALYRKWRPRTFGEVVGQEHVVRTLRNALITERIHHAYLFAGPRGTGKTTLARLLAKAVNCLAPEEQRPCNECAICQAVNEGRLLDLIEIDAASNTGVDDVRELRERVGFRPNEARYKVYVVDEVHMLSNAAFNALLKTLEEPPPHAIFVLATTESHKIPATVLSRCQRFDFHRIPVNKIAARLEWVAEQERIQADQQSLALIARQATGSMRDAISLLDQLASYDDAGITVTEVRAALGTGASETVIQITNALAEGDVAQGLGAINTAVDEGADPRQFARQMVEHLRALLLLRLESGVLPPHVSDEMRPQLEIQAAAFSRRALAQAVRLFNQAAAEAKGGWQPQLPLEMAFIEAMLPPESESRSPRRSRPSSAPPKPVPVRSASPSPPQTRAEVVRESTPTYQTPTVGGGSLTPETLQGRWSEFLDALRPRNLSLEALVRSCEPVAVEGNIVVLGFTHKFHRSKVEEEQKKQIVEDVLSTLFGQRCRVRCILSDRSQTASPSPQRSTREAAASEGTSSAEQLIAEDPLVRAAVKDLGAQILDFG
jgi:DNA polymerase III subunit gamma/tau